MYIEECQRCRRLSSRPSSSTNTIGGTPDAFVVFISIGSLAVSGVRFTVLLTSRMASACSFSISNRSGWLLQNCASVCCPHLQVLLVCLLELAISHIFQQILRMFSKFAYYAFTHLTRFPTITGDASVTQEKCFLPHSASFENVFQIWHNWRSTLSFAILVLHKDANNHFL